VTHTPKPTALLERSVLQIYNLRAPEVAPASIVPTSAPMKADAARARAVLQKLSASAPEVSYITRVTKTVEIT